MEPPNEYSSIVESDVKGHNHFGEISGDMAVPL